MAKPMNSFMNYEWHDDTEARETSIDAIASDTIIEKSSEDEDLEVKNPLDYEEDELPYEDVEPEEFYVEDNDDYSDDFSDFEGCDEPYNDDFYDDYYDDIDGGSDF